MKLTRLLLLTFFTVSAVCSEESLDDLTFEDEKNVSNAKSSIFENLSTVEENETSVFPKTEEEKKELLKKVLTAGLKRPGAWTRLGQVLPIVRIMSAPQRLALASLVMAQVLAGPGDPALPITGKGDSHNMTAQLMLPISADIATMFRGLAREQQSTGRSNSHFNPDIYHGANRIHPLGPNIRRPPPTLPFPGVNRRNANVHPSDILVPPRRGRPQVRPLSPPPTSTSPGEDSETPQFCDPIVSSLCVNVHNYPIEAITRTMEISANKAAFGVLLTDIGQNIEPAHNIMERRFSDTSNSNEGHMCSSTTELVRPKRARATSGKWKYIVNTGEYKQTLRLELCSKPTSSCTYLSEDVESHCVQVYNYHRLLTWDETAGLTMDIFKVPTCCSCHVRGYGGMTFPKVDSTTPKSVHEHSESNLVVDDHSHRAPSSPKVKGVRVRPYVPPKRESGTIRRPVVQHRGPPLPLESDPSHETRFPPYDNHLRRTNRNNTADSRFRVKFGMHPSYGVGLNQRHPALPADSIHLTRFASTAPTTSPPKKINYSYHPIIDFFRPATAESRMGLDWTPITDHPRSLA